MSRGRQGRGPGARGQRAKVQADRRGRRVSVGRRERWRVHASMPERNSCSTLIHAFSTPRIPLSCQYPHSALTPLFLLNTGVYTLCALPPARSPPIQSYLLVTRRQSSLGYNSTMLGRKWIRSAHSSTSFRFRRIRYRCAYVISGGVTVEAA